MADFKVITASTAFLAGKLNYLNQRHHVLSQNVAQIETPGYLTQDLNFEGFLKKESAAGDTVEVPILELQESAEGIKANGNSVNIEKEIGKLTENSVEYLTAIEVLKKNISLMKLSVGG